MTRRFINGILPSTFKHGFSYLYVVDSGDLIVRPMKLVDSGIDSDALNNLQPRAACGDTYVTLKNESPWKALADAQLENSKSRDPGGVSEVWQSFFMAAQDTALRESNSMETVSSGVHHAAETAPTTLARVAAQRLYVMVK